MERLIIRSKHDFIELVGKLASDFRASPENWESKSIDTYLETIARYAEDIPGLYKNLNIDTNANEASWQLFADLLVGSSIYE